MKIVEIVPQLRSGGAERFVVDLCNELVRMGNKVTLIVLYSLDDKAGFNFYLPELSKTVDVISMNKKPGTDLSLFFRLYKTVKRLRPDVVHSHLRSLPYLLPGILLRNTKTVFHTVHNDARVEASDFINRSTRKFLFRHRLCHPVTISAESDLSFAKYYGEKVPRTMIFNGRNIPETIAPIDLSAYRTTPDTRIIINLASVSVVKRQDLIARTCRRLELEGYDFAMLMIGHKAHKEVISGVEVAGCSRVHMLGKRTNPLSYLTAADGYCLMSSYEGMPISLIEAMGCRAVPVCTPVGGIKDVINDGVNGILATNTTEEACYTALKRFLDLPVARLRAMGDAARSAYLPYSMHQCADKYINLFNNTIY